MTTDTIVFGYGEADAADALASPEGQRALAQIEAAAARFERGRGALRRPDGSSIYSEAERREREAALVVEFDAAARPIHDAAEQDEAAARTAIAALEGSDPIDTLKGDDLSRAGGLRAFVAEECAELPLSQLTPRLRSTLAGTDKAALVLWARYSGRRLDHIAEARGPEAASGDVTELRDLVSRLQAAIADPQADAKRGAAIRRVATARAVQQRVNATRRQLDGEEAAAQAAMRQRYSGVL